MMGRQPARWIVPGLLVAGLLTACSPQSANPEDAAAPRAVKVVSIETRPLEQGLQATGRLISREEVAISSQIPGYQVSRVLVDQGAYVQKDQILAELDDTLLKAEIAQRRAALQQARVAVDKATQEAGRAEKLQRTGALSQEAINTRLLAQQTAEAGLAQAQAALDAQLVRQNLMQVRAPVAGRVLSRAVRPGDISATGTVMFRIASGGEVEVDAELPERSVDLIKVGQGADVELQSGAHVRGTVRLVSAEIDRDTKLGRARVLLPIREDLRPGGFAHVVFDQSSTPVKSVREGAVRYGAEGATVVIVGDGNKVSTVRVKVGRRANGYVEVLEGPDIGARVLLGAQGFVLDGDEVTPVDAAPEGSL